MAEEIGVYRGRSPNPYIQYGQQDMENMPLTLALKASRTKWDVQLSNGLDRMNNGLRLGMDPASQFVASVPRIPGALRLSGQQQQSAFPIVGMAPSQWDQYTAQTAGAQPSYPGGPGTIMGTLVNPGTGA